MHADIRAGAELLVLQGELLPDQREHGGVREMEQGDAGGEDQQWPTGEEDRKPDGWCFPRLGIRQAARHVVVDRAAGIASAPMLASDIAAMR